MFILGQLDQLQTLLSGIPDVVAAYLQAPPANMMQYPCILYSLDDRGTAFADNNPYRHTKRYQVTVIDRNVRSTIPDEVAKLPMCSFDRRFMSNNLYHEVFNLYF